MLSAQLRVLTILVCAVLTHTTEGGCQIADILAEAKGDLM